MLVYKNYVRPCFLIYYLYVSQIWGMPSYITTWEPWYLSSVTIAWWMGPKSTHS